MNYILLLDDEAPILKSLQRLLARTPCTCNGVRYPLQIVTETDPAAALEYVRHHTLDLIVSDYRMLGMDGVSFLTACKEIQPDCMRLILSGYTDLNALVGAINQAQIFRFLSKPWNDYELVATIGQALAFRQLQIENQRLADEARVRMGELTPQELERRRLEALEPGLTAVRWGPDGSVLLDDGDI